MSKNESLFYRIRRRGQVIAYRLTSPEFVSRIYFKHELGYKLNLQNPTTFNEKLTWLKLYEWPNNPKAIQCADKYAVRSYIESVGKGEILNDLIGVWDSAKKIDWNSLPNQFALKCNHGCGYNCITPNHIMTKLRKKSCVKNF